MNVADFCVQSAVPKLKNKFFCVIRVPLLLYSATRTVGTLEPPQFSVFPHDVKLYSVDGETFIKSDHNAPDFTSIVPGISIFPE